MFSMMLFVLWRDALTQWNLCGCKFLFACRIVHFCCCWTTFLRAIYRPVYCITELDKRKKQEKQKQRESQKQSGTGVSTRGGGGGEEAPNYWRRRKGKEQKTDHLGFIWYLLCACVCVRIIRICSAPFFCIFRKIESMNVLGKRKFTARTLSVQRIR